MSAIADKLAIPLRIPLWAFVVLVALALPVMWRAIRSLLSGTASGVSTSAEDLTDAASAELGVPHRDLSDVEVHVIRALVALRGQRVSIGDISNVIHKNPLIVEQAMESLEQLGMIHVELNYLHGPSFRLSSQGRDYAIEKGFVQ